MTLEMYASLALAQGGDKRRLRKKSLWKQSRTRKNWADRQAVAQILGRITSPSGRQSDAA
jgi:hypothetical protein